MAATQLAATFTSPLQVVPIVNTIINGIFTVVCKIKEKARQAKANKRQCQTLSERIERVALYLRTPQVIKLAQHDMAPLTQTIESFHAFVNECLEFISQFVDTGWMKRFISSAHYQEEFANLNNQLQNYYSEFTMGINVHNLIDRKQDEYDQREDQEILTTLIQQQQIMIQQQNAYFHFHSKQIDHGFQVLAEKIEGLREKSQDKENMLVQDRAAIPQTFNVKDLTSSEIEKSAVLSSSLPSSNNIFINGVWFNRYQQYGVWYGPFQHCMSFNANNNIFQGHGEDNVGQFILSGQYSKDTQQINVIQSYKYGTGDPQLNFGHQCLCKMTWNKERHVFEGIMFVPDGWTMVPCGLFEMSFVES